MPWQRIITALIMLVFALYAIFFLPLETFSGVVAIIVLIGSWEWSGFFNKNNRLLKIIYVLITAAFMWVIYNHSLPQEYWNGWIIPEGIKEWFQLKDLAFISVVLACIWWVFAFVLVLVFPKISSSLINNIFLMAIIGWLMLLPTWVALTGIRSIGMALDFHRGSSILLFSLCLVWAADTGAFIAGKAFGKHKLAPHVSPKKTWEGVVGGAILAILVAIISSHLLSIPDKQLPGLALMVVVIVSYSVIGDLTESIFKRLAGVKDSGNILPGHGGVLDRIDGLTAVMPLCLLGYAILGIN
ncbi:MAG: phosphatidate cytidylyltransferase [Gammaproteobacteria bacterium]|nr:phosphatidate cytidylyltransferase [Gammaproteobacteria bacterium]